MQFLSSRAIHWLKFSYFFAVSKNEDPQPVDRSEYEKLVGPRDPVTGWLKTLDRMITVIRLLCSLSECAFRCPIRVARLSFFLSQGRVGRSFVMGYHFDGSLAPVVPPHRWPIMTWWSENSAMLQLASGSLEARPTAAGSVANLPCTWQTMEWN